MNEAINGYLDDHGQACRDGVAIGGILREPAVTLPEAPACVNLIGVNP